MILRANQHKKMIWKNGGGITYEIDRQPNNDSEDFDWRLSMAQIKYPGGPFSIFTNIDRTLAIIDGNSLILNFNNDQLVKLDQNSSPYSFPGEMEIKCQIDEETITDFNVMTKRNKFQHIVQRIILTKDQNPINISNINENIIFIIVAQGNLQINEYLINKGDAFKIIDNQQSTQISTSNDNTIIYFVTIIILK